MSWPGRLLKWIEPEDNPRNTIYGTIAAGLVIAAEDAATETYPRVITATAVAVMTYWIAHAYAHWVAERFRASSAFGGRRPARQLIDAFLHEWPLIEGAAIPLVVLVIGWAMHVPLTTDATAALATAAGALVLFEVAGGLRRRVRARQLATNAVVGLALGAALFAVKSLLH